MRDRPNGAALLGQARTVLLDALLEQLPDSAHYTARLVANAMAIAAREQAVGERPWEAERAALAALFEEERPPPERNPEALDEALLRLSWRLAAELRGGVRDADAEVYRVLRESVIARLRLAKPTALDRAGVD